MKTENSQKYHHGDLAEALVRAAFLALESGGPEAVSLRDLARGLGVSANAPYRHFSTKSDLLQELVRRGFVNLTERFLEVRGRLGASAVEEIGRAYLRFATERPGTFRLMFSGVGCGGQEPGESYQILSDAIAARLGPEYDRSTVASAALGAWCLVHGYATLAQEGLLPFEPPLEQLLSGLARSLSVAHEASAERSGG